MVTEKPLPNFIAFGNCLVDQSVQLTNDALLRRHNIQNPNELGERSQKSLDDIMKDVKQQNLDVKVHLGGSALNTCRILSGLSPARILFCGAVGADDNGQFVEQELQKLGIGAFLQISSTAATGTCICLIHKQDRCCFANIGASKDFSIDDFSAINFVTNPTENVVFYLEGFFLTERSHVCRYIIEQFTKANPSRTFAVNLSASYIIENHLEDVNYLVSQADIVFGNTDEFEVLAKCNQKDTLIEFICSLKETMERNEKVIVITNGNQPIDIYTLKMNESLQWETLDVRVVSKKDIVDTTGAGDAFVSGFFHSFLKEDSIRDCVNFGMEVAVKKLKNVGAHLS